MVRRRWVALLVGTFVLAAAQTAQASDTIRLGGSVGGNTFTLDRGDDADADTELARFRGGYGGGGYRGGYGGGGYRGGYGYGGYRGGYGYGGYRGGYSYGGYRGGYGYGGYRGGYGYGGYGGGYYGSSYGYSQPYYGGYSSYYSYPSYCYPSYSYYYPCSDSVPTMPYATVLQGSVNTYTTARTIAPPAPVAPPAGDGTFRYDGGTGVVPAPMPGVTPVPPTVSPRPTLPLDGRLVSLPYTPPTVNFPAYGEAPATPRRPAASDTRLVSTPVAAPRVAYPAYGETTPRR